MKDKLQTVLGTFGSIIYWVLIILISVLPVVMIGTPFWLSFIIFIICSFIPFLSIPLWIWGLVEAIKGPQDAFAIIYYVATVIIFLPTIISMFSNFFKKRNKPKTENEKTDEINYPIEQDWKPSDKKPKKYSNTFVKLLITATALLLTLSVGLSIGLVLESKKNNQYKSKIDNLEILMESRQEKITQLTNLNNDYIKRLGHLYFYEAHAACVNENSNYYHKYGCKNFDDSSFWIYNEEAAKAEGYKPCPNCIKDNNIDWDLLEERAKIKDGY